MSRFGLRALTLVCAVLVSCSTLACGGGLKSPTSPVIDPVPPADVIVAPAEPVTEPSDGTHDRGDEGCGAPNVPMSRCQA